MWGGSDQEQAVKAIQASLDSGVTLIDTAPAYGLGLSEELVGKAIAGRRDKVILATKCGLVWHTDKGRPFLTQDGKPIRRYLGPESIRYECEWSLKRLGTDHIDLYQTHWQDETTPIEDTMRALMDLKREGKIRAIGISNAMPGQMADYRRIGPVDSDQEKYSMLDREQEAGLLPYCLENGIAFLAYSPLANGLLTGKIGPKREFTGDDLRRNSPRFSVENREKIAGMLALIEPIARDHGLTLTQLVLAWTMAQPGATHVLAGARNPRQAEENAAAGNVRLSADELLEIRKAAGHYEERHLTA
jgi:aryl-alcohol dehydrogenase-like predicted oxidoreductase